MPIRVRFDKNGFYHPAFGRLGRGKNLNKVYVLPDAFAEKETIKVPVMDNTSKPPRPTGECREITRYKNLPSSVEIIEDTTVQELQARLDAGDEDAAAELAEIKAARMPKVATAEHLEKVTGRGKVRGAQSAAERTTGRARSRKVAAAE